MEDSSLVGLLILTLALIIVLDEEQDFYEHWDMGLGIRRL